MGDGDGDDGDGGNSTDLQCVTLYVKAEPDVDRLSSPLNAGALYSIDGGNHHHHHHHHHHHVHSSSDDDSSHVLLAAAGENSSVKAAPQAYSGGINAVIHVMDNDAMAPSPSRHHRHNSKDDDMGTSSDGSSSASDGPCAGAELVQTGETPDSEIQISMESVLEHVGARVWGW